MGRQSKRVIMLADCQSFYASVEKSFRPEYRDKPLVVAGDPERRSGIILAACPLAKRYGVTTAESLRESLQKCPDLVVIRPRMQLYISVSLQITEILESYTDLVEPFSIDEQHFDVTYTLKYFGRTPIELARDIQKRILHETGIYTRIGISENKLLAKVACDNFAKKNESGLFELPKSELHEHLWPLPVNKMFGIGTRTMVHLHRIGINTVGELATIGLAELKSRLRRRLGHRCDVLAEFLWRAANGIDDSKVTPDSFDHQKGIGRQTTLPVDYREAPDIEVVLLELASLVCQRSRAKGYMGSVVHVGCQGADFDRPTGFSRQMKLEEPTNLTREVFVAAKKLFHRHWDGQPVRKLWVSLGDLQSDKEYQLTLFDDRERLRQLERTMDDIRRKHGQTAVMYASSFTPAGQARFLDMKIGGHTK